MSTELEECVRRAFGEHLTGSVCVQPEDVSSGVGRLLEKRREMKHVDSVLRTRRREFEVMTESVKQRREDLQNKEENLKEALITFNTFLRENDAKRARGVKKAESERAASRARSCELEFLRERVAALQARREKLQARVERLRVYRDFLHAVLQTAAKFEDGGELLARFETLTATREKLLVRRGEAERRRESDGLALRRCVSEHNSDLLRHNNALSRLQAELDDVAAHALARTSLWNALRAAAVRETHTLGQIKVATRNIYRMTGADAADDAVEQLEQIRVFLEDRAEIFRHLTSDGRNTSSRRSDRQ